MARREIAPGIHHWTATHPAIGIAVSCYFVARARTLLDPLLVISNGRVALDRLTFAK